MLRAGQGPAPRSNQLLLSVPAFTWEAAAERRVDAMVSLRVNVLPAGAQFPMQGHARCVTRRYPRVTLLWTCFAGCVAGRSACLCTGGT